MNLGNLLQSWGRKLPGHSWLSDSFLGDVVSGGTSRAMERNQWRFPVGHDTSSFDDIAGAGASRTHGGRNLARGIGALFGGGALYSALGGGSAAGSAGGASEVGYGFPLGEEAGAGGVAAEGQLSGPPSSMSWQDYLIRYGRQGANLLSNNAGQSGGQPYMPPIDNSMILPPPPPGQEDSLSSLPPGFLTMLLASAFQRQQQSQAPESPSIDSSGIV